MLQLLKPFKGPRRNYILTGIVLLLFVVIKNLPSAPRSDSDMPVELVNYEYDLAMQEISEEVPESPLRAELEDAAAIADQPVKVPKQKSLKDDVKVIQKNIKAEKARILLKEKKISKAPAPQSVEVGTINRGYVVTDKRGNSDISVKPVQSAKSAKSGSSKKPSAKPSQPGKSNKPNKPSKAAPEIKMDAQTKAYIDKYWKTAVAEMHRYGVPASITLAQGLIESRAGTSTLAVRNKNHFGIKCFSKSCGKGHCSNHTDDSHKDFFRIFKSPWESFRAHSVMVTTGRYAKLKKYGRDYRKWAYGLKRVGYATDRKYAETLIGLIERLNLQYYDSK